MTGAPAAPTGGAAPTAATPAPNATPGAPQGGRSPNAPSGAPSPSEKGRSPAQGARGNDGRFLPKDGNVGVEPKEPEAPEGETAAEKKERYRLKGKRKVYGQEVDFDLDEDAALNQLARARALEKRLGDRAKRDQAIDVLIHLAKTDPARLLKELGHEPDAWAQERVNGALARQAMSPEERRIADAEAERDSLKSQLETIAQQRQEAEQRQQTEALAERTIEQYREAMGTAGLEPTHANYRHMVEVHRLAIDDGIELTPAQLAAETKRKVGSIAQEHLASLDGPGLVRELGPDRVKLILREVMGQYRKAPGIPGVEKAPGPRAPRPGVPEAKPTTPAQVEENLRKLRMGEL